MAMAESKCLYEILGIDPTSGLDEIRSAYRRLALKWHPDKIQQSGASPEACQEATIHFQEIGRAYEVLADPAERAWYDSHRSQILSSAASPSGAPADFDINLWPYFSSSVFSGYGDTDQGFYAVYGDVFKRLHQQENAFARAYGVRSVVDAPELGNVGTPYSQVSKFYNHWLGFGTVKDFSWCDEYKTTLAPNRKVRRLIEEENKKVRSKARKEFNDVVRRLAAFVKKRDKRVLERQLEVQRLEKEKEEMLKLKRLKAKEEKILKAKLYEEAEWTKVSNAEQDRDDTDASDVDDSIGSYDWRKKEAKTNSEKDKQEEYFCIICNKKFKSDKQWRNHERSKKHVERAASLKESFGDDYEIIEERSLSSSGERANDENLAGLPRKGNYEEDDNVVLGSMTPQIAEMHLNETTVLKAGSNVTGPKDSTGHMDVSSTVECTSSDEEVEDDEASSLLAMLNSYTTRQHRSSSDTPGSDKAEEVDRVKSDEEGDAEIVEALLTSSSNRQPEDEEDQTSDSFDIDASVPNEDFIDITGENNEDIVCDLNKRKSKARIRMERRQAESLGRHARLAENLSFEKEADQMILNCEALGINGEVHELSNEVEPPLTSVSSVTEPSKKLENRNRMTEVNKAPIFATLQKDQARKPTKGKKSKGSSKDARNTCETCGEDFESRNQLFKHISVTFHSVPKGN